jgi:stearoyl-CoA desaturase (delta-9 desaturase)
MRIYNLAAYVTMIVYCAAAAFIAPPGGNPLLGLAIGLAYFISVWFLMGIYLGDVVHLGIAHRSLEVRPRFVQIISVLANLFGVYLNPITWTNRHRLHHRYSDHHGDPNKLAGDGFWATCYRMLVPYKPTEWVATDPIFDTWSMRLVSNKVFGTVAQFTSYGALWLLVRDWKFALVLWVGVRWACLYINIIQNYWTHDRRFGTRRYQDTADNAMNVDDWLPVYLTFSACLQNNHHHSSRFIRLSHDEREPDFGFRTVQWLRKLGLARPTAESLRLPEGATLQSPGIDR